ncbi:Multidrug resistance protein MdtC [termite gut metagenome]|uniref:Multidrug resistance protein MdtC n=1 Tax=termite gut metagenome TaxID=433724 RepID=A0A5J4S268_9ZZZZ
MNFLNLIIKRPTIIVVTFIVLVGAGLLSFGRLSQELFPRIEVPVITVVTIYPGASPEEVESSVSKKIEDAIASLENIDEINTTSMEGFSYVIVTLKDGTDVNIAAQNAQRKVSAIRSELPATVMEPSVDVFDINDSPIMTLSVTGNLDDTKLYDIVKNEVTPMFEQIPGIARIHLVGGREREIKVDIDEHRLVAYGLTIVEISETLSSSNADFPAGKINDGEKQTLIRLSGKLQSVEDIENIILKTLPGGSIVKVSDVANVYDGEKEVEAITRYNGVNAIGISVQKQSDANAVKVSKEVRKVMAGAEEKYRDAGLSFQVPYDSSEFTIEATDSVLKDLFLAILFVAIAILLCLHSFRNALIVMVSIPISLISTFTVMYLSGATLNLMTLMALSLVIGILVDDSIIVIENIHRHLEMGKTRMQATLDAVREIGGSILTLTLVLVVVFLPMAFLGGMIGGFFGQFSLVIAATAIISLLVSITIIPLLTSRYGKLEVLNTKNAFGKFIKGFENRLDGFGLKMKNLLKWSLSHKLITFGVAVLLFISSITLVAGGFIGTEFMDAGDRGEFFVRLKLPKDATIEQTNLITLQTEEILKQQPLITSLFTTVGVEENGAVQSKKAEIQVKMVNYDKRSITDKEYARQIKLLLQQHITEAAITSVPVSLMGDGDDAPISFYVMGTDMDEIMLASTLIMDELKKIPGISDPEISVESGNPEISITLNREKMARLSVSQWAIGEALNYAFAGNTDIKFRDNNREYDINIRLDKFNRKNKADVENFTIINAAGEEIKLKQIAVVAESESPSRLERHNRISSIIVNSMAVGRPSGDVGDDVIKAISGLNLPKSIQIEYAGDMKSQEEGFGDLATVMMIALALVYLLLVLLYNSYMYPLVILLSIPLSIIGVFFTLGLAGEPLGILTMVGVIILIGLVARNAILVVDFANQLRAKGMEVKEALLEATAQRFRPILMTTLSTIVGMLPIAIAKGAGAEWKNGLGWVLIGGLVCSMFLSLIVIPLVYYVFYRIQVKLGLNKSL